MDAPSLERLLAAVARGDVTPEEATQRLQHMPFEDLTFARLDTHRELRTGVPEVIFCPGKTPAQIREIAEAMLAHPGGPILATRADGAAFDSVRDLSETIRYDEVGRVIVLRGPVDDAPLGSVAVVCAGTSDIPVAQEAITVAEALG